jgi:hypothetical protein
LLLSSSVGRTCKFKDWSYIVCHQHVLITSLQSGGRRRAAGNEAVFLGNRVSKVSGSFRHGTSGRLWDVWTMPNSLCT